MSQNVFGDDAFGGQQDSGADAGAGWADAFGDDGNNYDLTFARTPLTEVVNSSTPGNKQKATGLQVNAAVNYDATKNQLQLELEFANQSGGPISDFDLMVNKNAFGVCPSGPCG